MTAIRSIWNRIGAFLMRHWLFIIVGMVVFIIIAAVVSAKKSQEASQAVEQGVTENVLTKRQVKAKDKQIAKLKDSIDTVAPIVRKALGKSDSARVANHKLVVKIDSLEKKILRNESTTADDDAPSRIESRLAAYSPRAYLLPEGGDSLR